MTQGEVADIYDLPDKMVSRGVGAAVDDDLISFEVLQRRYAQKVLNRVDGNKLRAAEILGVSRTTLYKILGADLGEGERSTKQGASGSTPAYASGFSRPTLRANPSRVIPRM